ncbi:MAG: acyl-CoA dehydrogenase family protein [Acidobacteria bacterium]|nr:acyl-CoA dehydrogenase family protein [Acidobacteriota bacterium]
MTIKSLLATIDDQDVLVQAVESLLREQVAPLLEMNAEEWGFPWAVWQVLRENGVVGFPFPLEHGGLSGSMVANCLIVSEVARYSANVAMILISNELAAVPLLTEGSPEQKERFLPDIIAGRFLATFAVMELEPEPGGLRTSARKDEAEYVLNGAKQLVTNAEGARWLIIFAKELPTSVPGSSSAFLVEQGTPGLSVLKRQGEIGYHGFSTSGLALEECRIPESNRIGQAGEGVNLQAQITNCSRPLLAALAVGLCQGTLDSAVLHAREHKQFGKRVAESESARLKLADMAISVEAARGLMIRAAAAFDQRSSELTKLGAAAKCFATDTAMRLTIDCAQMLGEAGYLHRFPLERRIRQAKLLQIFEGGNDSQRLTVSRALL